MHIFRWTAGLALAVVLVLGAHRAGTANAQTPPLTVADVLAATKLTDRGQLPPGAAWFETLGINTATSSPPDPLPAGFVLSATTDYKRFDGATQTGLVELRTALYADAAAAKAEFDRLGPDDLKDSTVLALNIGTADQTRAITHEYPADGSAGDAFRFETFVRFRSGRVIAFVDVTLPSFISAAQLGAVANPLAGRVASLAAGTSRAPALPPSLASMTPPANNAGLGSTVLDTLLTPENFAGGLSDPPLAVARYRQLGMTDGVLRVISLAPEPGLGIDAEILPVKDAESARNLTLFDDDGVTPSRGGLATGATGSVSLFAKYPDFNNYLYQFAVGRYYVRVLCYSNRSTLDIDPGCEGPTRKLAEAWYAALNQPSAAPTATVTSVPSTTPSPVPATPISTPTSAPTSGPTAVPTARPATATPVTTQPPAPPTPTVERPSAPLPPNTGSGGGDHVAGGGTGLSWLALALLGLGGAATVGVARRRRG